MYWDVIETNGVRFLGTDSTIGPCDGHRRNIKGKQPITIEGCKIKNEGQNDKIIIKWMNKSIVSIIIRLRILGVFKQVVGGKSNRLTDRGS